MVSDQYVRRIRIFISSPGDVKAEREALKHLIKHDLQRTIGDDRKLYLEPVMWEIHTIPGLGDIQEDKIFDRVGGFDVFIGFFWQRFGTPTGKYDSGSEAEFYKAYEMWQENPALPVLMYFCNRPYTPSAENIEQIAKVLQFKQEIADKGLYREYTEVSDLKDLVRVHLHKAILSLLGEEPDTKVAQPLDQAYRNYLDRLRRRCRLLPLGAFGFEHGAEDEVTLDQVYINLLTTARKKKPSEADERSVPDAEEAPVSALEAVEKTNRLMLLGDPGSGKSTFVNQMLADFSEARLNGLPLPAGLTPELVPVRVILRRFANKLFDVDLADLSAEERDIRLVELFVEQAMQDLEEELKAPEAAPALRQAFDAGRMLLVLDGLDEIPSAYRALMQQSVQALLNTYPAARTVITCRIRSYQEEDKHIPGFDTFTLAPFDDDQIGAFVTGWYNTPHSKAHFGDGQAKEKANNLTEAVLGPALNELARNPMLLTTMAVIHQRDIALPDQRARLYQLAVDVLLRRWQTHRGSDVKVSADLKAFLADDRRLLPTMYTLAYSVHAKSIGGDKKTADIRRGDALTLLEKKVHLGSYALAGEFLDYVDQRSGILLGHGGGGEAPLVYSFPHRTFQEYLAGCHIVSQSDIAEALIEHAARDDYWYVPVQMGLEELLFNRKQDWQLLRLAYQLCPPAFPQNDVAQQRLVLWAGVMAQLVTKDFVLADEKTPGGGGGFFECLRNNLVSLLSGSLPPIERAEAGRVLGHLGECREGLLTLEAMSLCYVPKGPFLMGGGTKETNIPYDYWIGQYPVTQAHFAAFVAADGYEDKTWWTEAGWNFINREGRKAPDRFRDPFDLPNHPIVGVTWYEAQAYIEWLTQYLQNTKQLEQGWRVGLASEPEWEKAARGGLYIPEKPIVAPLSKLDSVERRSMMANEFPGRTYPWGNETTGGRCNNGDVSIGTTTTPGCFAAGSCPYGLFDMAGNVWEWSRSVWKEEPYEEDLGNRSGREDPTSTEHRVLRGGSFVSVDSLVRCAARVRFFPDYRIDSVGFRIVVLPFMGEGQRGR